MAASHDEPGDLPGTPSGAAPRMARYGEGGEGRPARRERAQGERPRDDFFSRVGKFVRDVRSELGRTTWPNALEVRNTTIITIVAVAFFATYLYLVDQAFAKALEWVAGLFGGA